MAESRKPEEIELSEVKKDIADVEDDPNKLPEAPLADFMPAVKWDVMKSKIDNYEMESESKELLNSKQAADKVRELLENNDQALKALYKLPVTERIRGAFKKDKDNPTKDREKLITELQNTFGDLDKIRPNSLGSGPTIELEKFLGKKGLKLYKKAIEEESKSKHFRNAVFLQSAEHHAGAKWDKRLVLWIAGSSGSGKSHVVSDMIAKISTDIMSSSGDQSGNDVVTIDGGKGREVSQICQIVKGIAIRKGYKGIDDLDKKTKLDVKGKVKNAALKTKSLNLVIPDTFVRKFIQALKNISILRGVFNKYAEMQHTIQVFAEVTGGKDKEGQERFKRTVAFQGNSRAWFQNTRKNLEKVWNVIINNRNIGFESKKYHPEYFEAGREAGEAARKAYIQAQQKQGKDVYCLTCTNDRVYVYFERGEWKECGADYKGTDPVGLSYRAFQAWKEIEKNEKKEADPEKAFKAWIENPDGGKQEKFTSALIDITKEKPDFKPIADEKLSESKNFNIITLADVEKYLTSHPVAGIEYRKDGMDGKELYKLIKRIGESDPNILKHFENAYIYIKEKEGGHNKPGEYGALYKKVSDGATYLFKQDTSYEYGKAIKRERFGQPPEHHVAKDISEFVATRMGASIYKEGVAPEMVVKLHPAQKSPYIGSKYFGGGEGEKYVDLFQDVYQNYYMLPTLEKLSAELSQQEDKGAVYNYNKLKEDYLDKFSKEDKKSEYMDPAYLAVIQGLSYVGTNKEAKDFVENHIEAIKKDVKAIKHRPKVLGLKQFLRLKKGDIFKHAVSRRKENGELVYKGIEKALVLSALFADNDVHSGNIGVVIDAKGNRDCKRIDFGAALAKDYFNVERGLKLGSAERSQFWMARPTNHFTEYPKSVVYTENFAKAIDECVRNLDMKQELKLFDSPEFNLWPMADKLKFASYIGVLEPDAKNLNEQIKGHMELVLNTRLLSLETYALNIRLSQCFKKDEKETFILDPDKESELKRLIKDNKDKDIFKGFFEEDKNFKGGKIKLRSPETKSSTAKTYFRDKVKEMYHEVVEETPRRAEVRAPEALDEKTIREKAAFDRAHESDLARLDLKHDDEWKTTKKAKPDASSHMEGKMPKGFEKVQEKTVFSKKTTITDKSKAKASFTERCEADGRLSIISTSPPKDLVDDNGMPTWKCLQYVKDQIREILKAFPPPGKPIIEVHDERFLKAYALICRQNNIPFENRTGKEAPDLKVPADYEFTYKLKITPSLATSVSEFFTERSSRENTVAREISLNINSIKEDLSSTSEDKDKDMVTHSKFVTDSTLLGKILETPRLTDAQREDITKLKADLDRRIDHFKYPSLKR